MGKINYLLAFMIVAAMLISCGKDGAIGPVGATGPTGAQGPVGPAGPTGANGQSGSVIYSGTTIPNTTTGVVGDFYINLITGMLYGPKTTVGWGAGVALKGANGATGATGAVGATGATGAKGTAGSQIYSGSGAPVSTKGITGDYYLDITNYMLYGPKTAAGWGTPISLQGPVGPQGPAGPQGPQGNANVVTDVFTVKGTDWLWNSWYEFEPGPGGGTAYFTKYYTRANTSITQDVLTNGLVLVYFTPDPLFYPSQWAPLPYQFDSSFGYTFNYVYVTAVGQVNLMYFFIQTDPSSTLPVLSTYVDLTRSFKIVAITGKALSLVKQNHINVNDYQAISRVTGLWQQDKLTQ